MIKDEAEEADKGLAKKGVIHQIILNSVGGEEQNSISFILYHSRDKADEAEKASRAIRSLEEEEEMMRTKEDTGSRAGREELAYLERGQLGNDPL